MVAYYIYNNDIVSLYTVRKFVDNLTLRSAAEDIATPEMWAGALSFRRKTLHIAAFLDAHFSMLHVLLTETLSVSISIQMNGIFYCGNKINL